MAGGSQCWWPGRANNSQPQPTVGLGQGVGAVEEGAHLEVHRKIFLWIKIWMLHLLIRGV